MVEDRRHFMKTSDIDPLKKREEFAISLRKKKKQEILAVKRKRLPNFSQDLNMESTHA